MMLMLLLTELARLDVHLSVEQDGLKVDAPAGVLTDEVRQAMAEQKAALLQFVAFPYVETIDGLGRLTGTIQQRDLYLVAEERKEALRSRIGVVSLRDGIERFCYAQMVLTAPPETMQADEPPREVVKNCRVTAI